MEAWHVVAVDRREWTGRAADTRGSKGADRSAAGEPGSLPPVARGGARGPTARQPPPPIDWDESVHGVHWLFLALGVSTGVILAYTVLDCWPSLRHVLFG